MVKNLKTQVQELIIEGTKVKEINYTIPPVEEMMLPYISGNEYNLWMNKILILTKRFLTAHPLYNDIIQTYELRNNLWGTSAYDQMISYLEALVLDEEFLIASMSKIHEQLGEKKVASVFLSHSSKDKFFVRELAERMIQNGVKVWLDEAELNIGDSLSEKIGKAIDDTDFVCVVLSHNSINSTWVQKELQVALEKEFSGKKVIILPIMLESVERPPFLRDKLYADFSTPEKYNENFPKLLKVLGVEKEIVQSKKTNEKTSSLVETVKVSKPIEMQRVTQTEKKLFDFVDIKIIGFDEKKSYKPDNDKALYNLYLELSSTPPVEWGEIFEAERRFPRHTMWRRAWIEGKYIIVHCVPDELSKYHLEDLKTDSLNANIKYRNHLKKLADQELKELRDKAKEDENLSEVKNLLKFD